MLKKILCSSSNIIRCDFNLLRATCLDQSLRDSVNNSYHSLSCHPRLQPDLPIRNITENKAQVRNYAKSKNRPGKDKGSKAVHITDEEMSQLVDVEKMRSEFEETVQKLKDEFVKHLSIRTNLGNFEQIEVEFEGDKYPLGELAQVGRKNPTMVIVNSTAFPEATSKIMNAIVNSGMNVNPQQEGTTIYVPIPKVTKEHREGLAKNAKVLCEKYKNMARQIGSQHSKKASIKEDSVSKDTFFLTNQKINEITSQTMAELEQLTKNKQNEILQVNN